MDEKVQKIFKKCKKIMETEKIPISKKISSEVIINGRFKKTLGMCSLKNGVYTISLNKYILGSDEKVLEEIILHELIHTVRGCFNHSPKFKRYCQILNNTYGYNLGTHTDGAKISYDDNLKRIVYICPKCQRQFNMFKETQNKYQCSFCHVNIKKLDI